jgi:ABC-type Na+ efflux pump permease subunit
MATNTTPIDAAVMAAPIDASFGEHSFSEALRNALIVTRREVRDSFRDWRIMAPIFILTLVFPLLANGMTGLFTRFFESAGATPLLNNFLPLLPMIVGFFPVSISLVIALETFVGEKERRSLEPLLSTPLTNSELYIGKTLAAMIPPLMASYLGIGIYLGGLIFGTQQWRPEPELILQILCLTTTQALVMVTGAVVVSSQTTSTRASNLLASAIIIPISMLVMLESYIMVTNNRYVLWYIVVGVPQPAPGWPAGANDCGLVSAVGVPDTSHAAKACDGCDHQYDRRVHRWLCDCTGAP